MTNPDQHDLIGYLLGALEPAEQRQVESALESSPALRAELSELATELAAFEEMREPPRIPLGLANRTCESVTEFVMNHEPDEQVTASSDKSQSGYAKRKSENRSRRLRTNLRPFYDRLKSHTWSAGEIGVAAAACFVMGVLFFPAVANSRHQAQIVACQDNLRNIGSGLYVYSDLNNGLLPPVPESGNLAVAGSYAPRLNDMGLVEATGRFVCPSSELAAAKETYRLPSWSELEVMTRDNIVEWRKKIGGSYAYSMGFLRDGKYQPHRNQGRANFVILADAPDSSIAGPGSRNHGGQGQNVLCEDLSIRYVRDCKLCGCETAPETDIFFLNRNGMVAAGVDEHDAVVGPSDASPTLPFTLCIDE